MNIMRFIVNYIYKIYPNFVDKSPYRFGNYAQLRLSNSYKNIKNTDKEERYYPVSKKDFLNTVVQYTEDCVRLPESLII
jgi:hypothetical protein